MVPILNVCLKKELSSFLVNQCELFKKCHTYFCDTITKLHICFRKSRAIIVVFFSLEQKQFAQMNVQTS